LPCGPVHRLPKSLHHGGGERGREEERKERETRKETTSTISEVTKSPGHP
jgi:hypothetical protein